jgi:hypothetical protein
VLLLQAELTLGYKILLIYNNYCLLNIVDILQLLVSIYLECDEPHFKYWHLLFEE